MNLFNTISKKATIAMIIAATGIPASLANAQFKVDYSAKAESAPEVKTEKTVMVFQSNDDEHTYEIKIVNGEVVIAKVDGNDVDRKHVVVNQEIIIIMDDDGKAIHEIKLPEAPAVVDGVFPRKQWKVKMGTPLVLDADDQRNFRVQFAGEPDENGYFTMQGTATQPKVMLGINLGEPSKVLRKHLRLDDDTQVILVERVIKGLPAQLGGMLEFDVIISIDGSDEANGEILGKILSEKDAGDTMKIIVLRGGEKVKLKVDLAEYNAKALGSVELKGFVLSDKKGDPRIFEFEILNQLEDGEFGHIEGFELNRLREQLQKQLAEASAQNDFVIVMQTKAMDAMKQAERQMVEFRNGKLFVHSVNELDGHMAHLRQGMDQLHGHLNKFPEVNPEALHEHMGGMNDRLDALEDRLNRQLDQMTEQMDRLAEMFGRLMESLEEMND